MTVEYGSFSYIVSIMIPILFFFLISHVLRKFSHKVARCVVFSIMIINVAQHLLKTILYTHLNLSGFTVYSTAYNMCALLILLSPIAYFVKLRPLRDFVFLLGTFAGLIAIAIPYWSIGKPPTDPDFLRSLFCHSLLFLSSSLSLAIGLHRPTKRSFLFIGLYVLIALGIIALNNTVSILLGIYPGITTDNMSLSDALYATNSVWMYGPPESFSWLISVLKAVFPDRLILMPNGRCVPILWYALPMYLVATVIAYPICLFVIWYQQKFTKIQKP